MKIRRATEEDAPEIARVHVESWRSTYPGIISDDVLEKLSISRRTERWKDTLCDPAAGSCVFVAQDEDGQVLGFVDGGPERTGHADFKGEIYAMYLLEKAQGKGLGRRLFQRMVAHLRAQQIVSLLVWVARDNPSRRFYEALGGVQVERRTLEFRGAEIEEVAYGWKNIELLP